MLIFDEIFQKMLGRFYYKVLNIRKLTTKFLFLLLMVGEAFSQVKIEVKVMSPLPNPTKPIFVALDYGKWNPGDKQFQLEKTGENTYSITLTNIPDHFEYKFTQGSWMYVEGTPDGQNLPNRSFDKNVDKGNIIETSILGWEKQATYDILLENTPENTPEDAHIYIAGNFNNWETNNPDFELKKNQSGLYCIKLYSELQKIEYKFTRGSWESVEARESGKARPNRVIFRDSSIDNKAVNLTIEGWEDLMGTLHIYSLFDFLLLFSVFQGVLLIIAILVIQKSNTEANRWLVISIFVSSISIFFYIISNYKSFVNSYPLIVLLPDLLYFLNAPVFYFYLSKLLFNVKALPSRWYLHFIPFLIQFFAYLPFILQNDKKFLLDLMEQIPILIAVFGSAGFLGLIWNIFYWNLFRKTIKTYRLEFQTNLSYEHNLSYLNTVLIFQFIALCFWAFTFILIGINRFLKIENGLIIENSVDLTWLSFSLITYFVGYFSIHQSETYKASPQKISIFDDVLETTIAHTHKPTEHELESLKSEIEKLEAYIVKEKPYKNAKISLNDMATNLNIQPHLLSKIINEHYQLNFFDFINNYRVEEFKVMVKDPKNQNLTFLAIAYEVGFNSKTAFNRSFKKITNQTPREYFDSLKLT